MEVNATVKPSDTQHDISRIAHVTDERAPNGAFVITTTEGRRVRWESLDEAALTSLNESLFDTELRSLYNSEVDTEYPREEPTPTIIAPEIESYTRQTIYLSAAAKDELMNFYETSDTGDANRCHEQEATLRVALNHTDELVDIATTTDPSCEDRYALRIESATWRAFESRLLELELQHPSLESSSKTAIYEAMAAVVQNREDEFATIAASLA